MPIESKRRSGRAVALVAAVLTGSAAWPSGLMPPGLYEVTVETGMPNLEESLRYATTRERRCLTGQALESAFPILRDPSLADCRLVPEAGDDDPLSYRLLCSGGHGTTGHARWHLGPPAIRGTLTVRLGGKNMTFYQRVTARAVGECAGEA